MFPSGDQEVGDSEENGTDYEANPYPLDKYLVHVQIHFGEMKLKLVHSVLLLKFMALDSGFPIIQRYELDEVICIPFLSGMDNVKICHGYSSGYWARNSG
jgi:hypothetical protein